ncbi:hypothetical protein D3C87_1118010 [compost metagenome]
MNKQQTENDKGKRDPVVQAGFTREPEADRVVILGIIDLNQRSQYWVGRRQYGADQQRRPPGQVEGKMQQQAHAGDAQEHHWSREPVRHAPFAILERQPQFESADEH